MNVYTYATIRDVAVVLGTLVWAMLCCKWLCGVTLW